MRKINEFVRIFSVFCARIGRTKLCISCRLGCRGVPSQLKERRKKHQNNGRKWCRNCIRSHVRNFVISLSISPHRPISFYLCIASCLSQMDYSKCVQSITVFSPAFHHLQIQMILRSRVVVGTVTTAAIAIVASRIPHTHSHFDLVPAMYFRMRPKCRCA